ncbi:FIG004453: protein YceG like [hydrothermal vent metagenome]|uniref:FIG004453: protein YceG like n=1 Tax=hydrothermal vent metagenome TaxID=652676 RepID=A0A1W1CCE0_9ZZZZ
MLRIVEWVASIILLILISLIFYTTIPIKTEKTIYIPKGSVSNIITQLTKNGYMLSKIDKYILVLIGEPKYGWISISKKNINRVDFLYEIVTAKTKMVNITLIPSETTTIFLDEVSKQLSLDKSKLEYYLRIYSPYREAGIYADTYSVPLGINEKDLIKFLVSQSNNRYEELSNKIYGDYSVKKWNRVMTIASIIQKEAGSIKEMPLVSSVIYNRLKKNMRLQMDGTLNYGKYSHIKITRKRIKEDKSKFNTYKHKGLPPYPVSSISIDAIEASINPAKTNYLYFMKNSKGEHDFSKTYKKHREFIKKYK